MNQALIPAAKPIVGDDERAAVDAVLASGMLAQGPEVAAFEQEFAAIVGGRECVAVNSGTSALHMVLIALGIGAGDEVHGDVRRLVVFLGSVAGAVIVTAHARDADGGRSQRNGEGRR